MADISKEIQDFKEADYGEEVRDSLISLAEKVNAETENNTKEADAAAVRANGAADKAIIAKEITDTATRNANAAAASAEEARVDIQNRLASGEFKGDKGDKGNTGAQGQSGVMAPASGMFSLFLDPATGDLFADYPDGESPPAFEYDSATGDLYYVTG